MNLQRTLVGTLYIMAGVIAAYGQAAEASISFGASIFTDKNLGDIGGTGAVSDALRLDNGFRVSARFGVNSWRFLGHEFGYGYDRSKLIFPQGAFGMSVHQGFYDFMVHALPEGSPVRPFVCAGGGFSSFFPPGTSVFSGNGVTKFGYNYGAGVKVRVSSIYGLRLDVRDYVTGKPFDLPGVSGLLHNIEVSAGLAILF